MSKTKILIVEDDESIRFGLTEILGGEGFTPVTCERGDAAAAAVSAHAPELILLDVMLPGKNGFDVCRDLRASGCRVPVLMLTAKGQELDKVIGLDCGADDYVTKPFGVRELTARVRALLRRAAPAEVSGETPFTIGGSTISPVRFELENPSGTTPLTPKELGVLQFLDRQRDQVVTRDTLLDQVWGLQYFGTTRTVDQTVAQLRKKLGSTDAVHLRTVHGAGYLLTS
jgi:DNA-binding response OmpR family regulator